MNNLNRRTFIKSLAATTLASAAVPYAKSGALAGSDYFGLHPFIEQNPEAVFIMRTSVDEKTNNPAKVDTGTAFANSVFISKNKDDLSFPLSRQIVIKPNMVGLAGQPVARSMGIVTDPYFVEGVIESMKTLGIGGDQFYLREVNSPQDIEESGYAPMGRRTGADVKIIDTNVSKLPEELVVWKDIPDGIYFSKLPYLWPINAPDTFLLNIAKFKAHGMGLTVTAKNLQGSIAKNYQQHCSAYTSSMDIKSDHKRSDATKVIRDNFKRHKAAGVPRWDRPGVTWDCGQGMETWATRCLDNNSVTRPELHVIEGIYGHDGNFNDGPHNGQAKDFMSNVIVFGKNSFHVDIIGHWLAGHEPGNFGLFHMAIERGLSTLLNPADIPVYDWSADGSAVLTPFDQFERTPLLTYYLQRDYDGQSEEKWHLCDEAYNYAPALVQQSSTPPATFELEQNFPNPFNANTTIEFVLARSGHARLEIYNLYGQLVDVVADGQFDAGAHRVLWRANGFPTGTYIYRCSFQGYTKSGSMVLVK